MTEDQIKAIKHRSSEHKLELESKIQQAEAPPEAMQQAQAIRIAILGGERPRLKPKAVYWPAPFKRRVALWFTGGASSLKNTAPGIYISQEPLRFEAKGVDR